MRQSQRRSQNCVRRADGLLTPPLNRHSEPVCASRHSGGISWRVHESAQSTLKKNTCLPRYFTAWPSIGPERMLVAKARELRVIRWSIGSREEGLMKTKWWLQLLVASGLVLAPMFAAQTA